MQYMLACDGELSICLCHVKMYSQIEFVPKKYTHALFWTVLISVCDVETHLKPPLTFTFIHNSNQTMKVSWFACGASFPSILFEDFAAFLAPEPRLLLGILDLSWMTQIRRIMIGASFLGSKDGSCRPFTRPVCAYCDPQTGQSVLACCQGGQDIAFLCLTTFFFFPKFLPSPRGKMVRCRIPAALVKISQCHALKRSMHTVWEVKECTQYPHRQACISGHEKKNSWLTENEARYSLINRKRSKIFITLIWKNVFAMGYAFYAFYAWWFRAARWWGLAKCSCGTLLPHVMGIRPSRLAST